MLQYNILLIGVEKTLKNILYEVKNKLEKREYAAIRFFHTTMKEVTFEYAVKFDLIIADMSHPDYNLLYVHRLNEQAIDKLKIVIIGIDSSYLFVRKVFLSGVFDYWTTHYDYEIISDCIKRAIETDSHALTGNALRQNIINALEGYETLKMPIYDAFYRQFIRFRLDIESPSSVYFSVILDIIEPISFEPTLLSKSDIALFCTNWTMDQPDKYNALYTLLTHFARIYNEIFFPQVTNPIVRKAIYEVLSPKQQHKSVKYISEVLFTNQSHLSITFIKYTGITLSAYIKRVKLYGAMWMLLLDNFSMNDILLMLDYKDDQYFHRIFKHKTGYSPSFFKGQYKKYHLRK